MNYSAIWQVIGGSGRRRTTTFCLGGHAWRMALSTVLSPVRCEAKIHLDISTDADQRVALRVDVKNASGGSTMDFSELAFDARNRSMVLDFVAPIMEWETDRVLVVMVRISTK